MASTIIAICGMAGSGKSTVREFFQEKGYVYVYFGVTEKAIELYGAASEEFERIVRNDVRKEHGMAAMAVLAFDKIKKMYQEGQNIVIDNMYSWSEYKFLKDKFGKDFRTIAIHANPELRYTRLSVREERPRDRKTSISRDYSEIEELEKGGPITMSEFNIINEGSAKELSLQVENVYNKIIP